jgi:hypothetical protein
VQCRAQNCSKITLLIRKRIYKKPHLDLLKHE